MIGYPISYGDKSDGFTSETVIIKISQYWSDKENLANFHQGYKFGLLVFSISGVILSSTATFASNPEMFTTTTNGTNSVPISEVTPSETPITGFTKPETVSNVPISDRGMFGAHTLALCATTMKSSAYWVGFVCGAIVTIGISRIFNPGPSEFRKKGYWNK
jgi:hypothetical protein